MTAAQVIDWVLNAIGIAARLFPEVAAFFRAYKAGDPATVERVESVLPNESASEAELRKLGGTP